MPTGLLFKLSLLFAYLKAVHADTEFRPYYSLGATNFYIVEAATTLTPGAVQVPQVNLLALWPGMGTDGGGLIQSIVVRNDHPQSECGGSAGQWCTFASLYTGTQQSGKEVPVNGQTVSTLTSDASIGKAIGWGTAVECHETGCSVSSSAHKFTNTKITLAAVDPSFKGTLATFEVDATELVTNDNVVFTVDTINVHEYSH